jgi:hypothetical protein
MVVNDRTRLTFARPGLAIADVPEQFVPKTEVSQANVFKFDVAGR